MRQERTRLGRRTFMKLGLAATTAGILSPVKAPAQVGRAKQFSGVTINAACFSSVWSEALKGYVPEFEQQTGMKVNFETQGFPVYNQRADLELSTKGSSYDVLNISFIYTSRWIGSGWFAPLDELIADPRKTPTEFDPKDFLSGSVKPLQDKNGRTYAFPWMSDATMGCASRYDLITKAGFGMPTTFDEIAKMLEAIHDKDGVKGFTNENHHGWSWPPYLHAFGGDVFRKPPEDIMPTLDTPEAIAAAEFYGNLLRKYGPPGVLSYNQDQSLSALLQGRANYTTNDPMWLSQLGDPSKSKVTGTVNFSMFPAGPKGRFPPTSAHGLGIPVGAKNKDAAWEFIKWANSKEMCKRMLVEKRWGAQVRRSVINSAEFRKVMTINNVDVADLYVKTLVEASRGHMAYRTVHVYPMVNAQINKLIENVASGQMSAKDACRTAQRAALAELRRAGVKL